MVIPITVMNFDKAQIVLNVIFSFFLFRFAEVQNIQRTFCSRSVESHEEQSKSLECLRNTYVARGSFDSKV